MGHGSWRFGRPWRRWRSSPRCAAQAAPAPRPCPGRGGTGSCASRQHDCIVHTDLSTGDEWPLARPGGAAVVVKVAGRMRVSASEGMRAAALEGLSVAVGPARLFKGEPEGGTLERALDAFEPPPLAIPTVYPSRHPVPARVGAFADFLQVEFRGDPRLA